jgi:hypothetical protein
MSYNLFYLTIMRAFNCFKYHEVKIRILHFKATTHFFTLSTFYYERFSQITIFRTKVEPLCGSRLYPPYRRIHLCFGHLGLQKRKCRSQPIKKKAVVALAVPP